MKKLACILLFSISSILLFAEKQDKYTASNGKTYQIGDTIKLGKGSAPNGDFIYLQMGGFGYGSQAKIGSGYAGLNVTLKKIKEVKFKGAIKTIFIVGGGNIVNYYLTIEDAISTCEIEACTQKVQKVEMVNKSSKIDEIKKLKELLDNGTLTKEEFESEKKKLLSL